MLTQQHIPLTATYKSRRIAPRIRWTERKPITTCVSFDETELRASYCAVYLDHTSIHHSQGVDKDKIIRSHLNRTPCREWLRSASAWEFLCANACAYHLAACQPRVHAPWGATHLDPPPRRTLRPQSPGGKSRGRRRRSPCTRCAAARARRLWGHLFNRVFSSQRFFSL